ncbi:MAG: BrnT family toxin [bacterium]
MMAFEFDQAKSRANRTKHGIDFVEAQALWDDVDLLELPARTEDEPRWIVIGRIGTQLWSAIITYRKEKTRIISVRRSREMERDLYES